MPLHQTSGRWRLGLALSLVTTFLWGILPIALAVTLQSLDIYTVTWFRFVVAFGLLAIYSALQPNGVHLKTDLKNYPAFGAYLIEAKSAVFSDTEATA